MRSLVLDRLRVHLIDLLYSQQANPVENLQRNLAHNLADSQLDNLQ